MAFSDIHTRNVLSQCTFWCPVLSDPMDRDAGWEMAPVASQCTFWCSVLCDWTLTLTWTDHDWVSMHLLVLSAFRREGVAWNDLSKRVLSQCTFWCSVLSDNRKENPMHAITPCLNAPSGAQCFPTKAYPMDVFASAIVRSQCTFWCWMIID